MKTFIIAEAGVNHNGSIKIAKSLIDKAKVAKADAIKFQSFKGKNIIRKGTEKCDYQKGNTLESKDQLEMVSKLELSVEQHHEIFSYAREVQLEVISTPFDLESIELLENLNVNRYKIPSGEVNNPLLLYRVAQTKKPIILSTGMATLGEIETALSIIAFGLADKSNPSMERCSSFFVTREAQELLKKFVSILHCTTQYPAPPDEVNLNAMNTIQSSFNLPVGYSDHTEGIGVSIAAVALGASIVEKHFTLDRSMNGPDHSASIEPKELEQLVQEVRRVEQSLGSTQKIPTFSELKNISIVRRSIVAKGLIKKGETFSLDNLTLKRPGTGLNPLNIWRLLSEKATQDYSEDDFI